MHMAKTLHLHSAYIQHSGRPNLLCLLSYSYFHVVAIPASVCLCLCCRNFTFSVQRASMDSCALPVFSPASAVFVLGLLGLALLLPFVPAAFCRAIESFRKLT